MNYKKITFALSLICIIFLGTILFLLKRDGYFTSLANTVRDTHYSYIDNAQYPQRETMFELSNITQSDIVFVGDSITARSEWQEFFPDYTVLNRGIDSDVTQGVYHRLSSVVKTKPQKVFVMIGINDIRQHIDIDESLTYYSMIMSELKSALPDSEIYIQSILPVHSKTGISNKEVEKRNASIKELAETYQLTYINIFDDMIDENNDLPSDYSIDGVHMTGAGYQVWLNILKNYIP